MFVTILERLGLLVLVFLNSIYLLIKYEDKCMFNPSEWRDAREVKTWQYGYGPAFFALPRDEVRM